MAEGPDFNLRGLRAFEVVCETGSLTAAAGRLGLSRSAVSQRISNLESEVGATLFDRSARPLALTPAGTVVARHARRILEAAEAARAELIDLDHAALGQLRLGVIDDLDASITPALVEFLRARYRDCQVSATSGRSDDLTAALEARRSDIAVTGLPPEDAEGFLAFPLLREPFVLVAAAGVLDRAGDVAGQIEALPFIGYSPTMPLGRTIARHLRRLRLGVPEHAAFDASRSVFAMVCKARGWAITTPLCVLDSARFAGQLDILPLPFAGLTRTISLIARDGELGTVPAELADLCSALIRDEITAKFSATAPWIVKAMRVS